MTHDIRGKIVQLGALLLKLLISTEEQIMNSNSTILETLCSNQQIISKTNKISMIVQDAPVFLLELKKAKKIRSKELISLYSSRKTRATV